MSRTYCRVCGNRHDNKGEGLCDFHRDQQEAHLADEHNKFADALNDFMARSEEDRWEAVFTFMHSRGFET
jgi:hypothetical protein